MDYFGQDTGTTDWTEYTDWFLASRFQNTVGAGNLVSVSLRFAAGSHSGNVKFAVYADSSGNPGALLRDCGSAPAADGLVTVNSFSPLAVTSGTYYWLAFCLQASNDVVLSYLTGDNTLCWASSSYSSFPPSSAPSVDRNDSIYNMLAGVEAGGEPTPPSDGPGSSVYTARVQHHIRHFIPEEIDED